MRSKYNKQLEGLNLSLIQLGALCESSINSAVISLLNHDKRIIEEIKQRESEIDQSHKEIESLCLKLLLQQQPVASDLRFISAALKLVTDLERIGDNAADIADIVTYIDSVSSENHILIEKLGDATSHMVRGSIEAFVKRDVSLAKEIIEYDNIVDNLFSTLKRSIIRSIDSSQVDGEGVIDLLMCAKYFERIGDHATNVAAWAIYASN